MSRKIKAKETKLSNLFITDQALNSAEFDEFGHVDYASLLERLINEQPTPFNIGIFGRWGVGKSTIVNLLKERLEVDRKKGKIKILEVKVWKYDENSLRRKFIVKIAEGLGLERNLDEINRDIYYEKEFETALLNYKDILSTIFNKRSIALLAFVVSLILLLIIRLINIIDLIDPFWNYIFKKSEEIIIIPLVISILTWVFQIINTAKLKLKIGKFDSEEQFENEFIKLIKKDKSRKVIFIDDLDRCSKEKVVKTLETIKTFLDVETCIFIIACDDEIIIEAINRSHELYSSRGRNEGAEYLEKFFQYTLYIPPFMVPDMRKYIYSILKRNNSALINLDKTLEDIVFILINKDIKNPRNAITAINAFSSAFLLATEREENSQSRLHNRIITDNLPVLAIVTRLRYHFPSFYDDLLKNNDLIYWLISILEGNKDQLTEKQIETCEKYFLKGNVDGNNNKEETSETINSRRSISINWDQPFNEVSERLFDFLESIKDYLINKNLSAFLYLGIDSTSYLIGDEYLQDFNDALKNGIDSRIERILSKSDESKKEHLFDHICNWIYDHLEGVERRKALQTLSRQFDKCPDSRILKTARTLSQFYDNRMEYEEYKKYSPSGIFKCVKFVDKPKRNAILSQAISFLCSKDLEYDKLILAEIFKHESIITDTLQIKNIRGYLENREMLFNIDGGDPIFTPFDFLWIKQSILSFRDQPQILNKFFSGEVVIEVLNNLIEVDSIDTSPDTDEYLEAKLLFEILKDTVFISDKKLLCKCYRDLVETRCYFENLLEDIERNIDGLPFEEIDSLAFKLIDALPTYIDVSNISIERTFTLTHHWFNKFSELSQGDSIGQLATQIIELIKSENSDVLELCLKTYPDHKSFFNIEQNESILGSLISLIDPFKDIQRSKRIREILIKDKSNLTPVNKLSFVNRLASQLSSLPIIRDNDSLIYWQDVFDNLLDVLKVAELDPLIKPNDSNNLLSINFQGATNDDRIRYGTFISKSFDKLSPSAQTNYCNIFVQFLNTQTKENGEYAINSIYLVLGSQNGLNTSNITAELLTSQFNLILDDSTMFMNIQLIYSYRESLSNLQISETVKHLSSCVSINPADSLTFVLLNWKDFSNQNKFQTLSKLLPTGILKPKSNLEAIIEKIKNEYVVLSDDEALIYLNELEHTLKESNIERDFFADLIKQTVTLNDIEFKMKIKSLKVTEIKVSTDIDLCRNKFSLIIGLKASDYERDQEVNDLFFNLLNDTVEKKKLAIDVFEYYYEGKHPHSRKHELTERFNNLHDLLDHEYKETIKRLAIKYELKVKKSFFDALFGG